MRRTTRAPTRSAGAVALLLTYLIQIAKSASNPSVRPLMLA